MANDRSIISQHTDKLGQRMIIYSEFCRNYWLVEGYGVNGNLLFTGERIDYWEYRAVVERFMGMPLKAVNAHMNKREKPVEIKGSQTALPLESIPIHGKQLTQKELDNEIKKLRLIVA